MKPPFSMEVRTDNQTNHSLKLVGADGDEREIVIAVSHGANPYSTLHMVKDAIADTVNEVCRLNGVEDFVPPPPAEEATGEPETETNPEVPEAKKAKSKKAS